jgi:hypothetical protein
MFGKLYTELKKRNVVVIDTLPKARLMNKLLLAKIAGLSIILLGLLKLAGWNNWMLGVGALVILAFTIRGWRRDISHQNVRFGTTAKAEIKNP